MKKIITAVIFAAGYFFCTFSAGSLEFSGLNDMILTQNSSFETESSTPRITKKKRAEYSENKSPLVAAGLSLLLPGSGEYYGRDYLRSGIFFGIEAFTVSMWYYYKSDGDDKKDEYRSYADTNFEDTLYYGGLMGMTQNVISWLEDKNSTEEGFEFNAADVWSMEYFEDRNNWDWDTSDSLAVSDLLDLSFNTFNQDDADPTLHAYWERVIQLKGGSAQFTHNLPESKTQQYYEMVGKYHQFACGWNDFDGYEYDENGDLIMETVYIQNSAGEQVAVEIPKLKLDNDEVFNYSENGYNSPQVDFYEDLRDKTNKAYEKGQNFLMITLLNHVASAFDASYVIKKNFQIDTGLEIESRDSSKKIGMDNYKITYSVRW